MVGIIGRNGAGKSTLLKILSRITEPTEGAADIHGRVGSLLEVGTGFHPELTGRENIYLNGAILGMRRAEIARKFDEIVAFAEVEKFIDTPVKHYSSGMYMRLAFAVAAHLEPEILIVDEVLAVGDAEFQKKCLGKMEDISRADRTVLFVSHNMHAIQRLCSKVIVLNRGSVQYIGSSCEGVKAYEELVFSGRQDDAPASRREGSGEYRFIEARPDKTIFQPGEAKTFSFRIARRGNRCPRLVLSGILCNESGSVLLQVDSRPVNGDFHAADEMSGRLVLKTPWLKPGDYRLDLWMGSAGFVDKWEGACYFRVSETLPYPLATSSEDVLQHGLILGDYHWSVDP